MSSKEKIFVTTFFILLGCFIASCIAICFWMILGNARPRLLGLTAIVTLVAMPVVLILDAAIPDQRKDMNNQA